jgi:hypothetical protein
MDEARRSNRCRRCSTDDQDGDNPNHPEAFPFDPDENRLG